MKQPQKLYVVQRFVWATSVNDALKKEKTAKPEEIFQDNTWRSSHPENNHKIGFSV